MSLVLLFLIAGLLGLLDSNVIVENQEKGFHFPNKCISGDAVGRD